MGFTNLFCCVLLIMAAVSLNTELAAQTIPDASQKQALVNRRLDPTKLVLTFRKSNVPRSVSKSSSGSEVQIGNPRLDAVLKQYNVSSMSAMATADNMFVIECENCDTKKLQLAIQDQMGTAVVVQPYEIWQVLACPVIAQTTNDRYPNISMLDQISARCAWNLSYGRNSTIGLVDVTGAGFAHADIDGKILSSANLANTSFRKHGLYMAGVMAAAANNDYGIPGVARSSNLRIYNAGISETGINSVAAVEGINRAVQDNVDVINLSFTFPNSGDARAAILNAISKGIPVVTASGNSNTRFNDGCNVPGIICVTSVDQSDRHEATGNKSGSSVSISAPDRGFTVLEAGNTVATLFGGTSLSSAIVSAAVAMMIEANPNMSVSRIKGYLECSSDDISSVSTNGSKFAGKIGKGRLNVYGAVQQALMDRNGISGPTTIGQNGSYSYSLPSYPGASYTWTAQGTGLTIQSGRTGNVLGVSTNSSFYGGRVECVLKAGRCTQTRSYTINGPRSTLGYYSEVFPNPTSGDINVNIQHSDLEASVESKNTNQLVQYKYILFDRYAKPVAQQIGGSSAAIRTDGLPSGLYTLKIVSPTSSISQQVVIDR